MSLFNHANVNCLFFSTLLLLVVGCADQADAGLAPSPPEGPASAKTAGVTGAATSDRPAGWDDYWYAGEAELNSYRLTQKRYGADRTGEAVLIFVTEPFLFDEQVKQDDPETGGPSVSVLKLNRIHRFRTGIYDYSLMLSVFTPVSRDAYPHTLKTTLSSQDWCGQSWWQLNFGEEGYTAQRRSYFQAEADAGERLPTALLEDELLNLVRIDPALVPTGEQRLIPGAMFSSLDHKLPKVQLATVSFSESGQERVLEVKYAELERTLTYRFAAEFPNHLLGWTETFRGEEEASAELLSTRMGAYWTENQPSFSHLRDSLQL